MPFKNPSDRKKYLQSPEQIKKQRERQAQRKINGKRITDTAKSVPCTDCGKCYPPYVMDFDHVRGSKVKQVGKMLNFNETKLLEEIAKCDVVCSNCHRERTYQRQQNKTTAS